MCFHKGFYPSTIFFLVLIFFLCSLLLFNRSIKNVANAPTIPAANIDIPLPYVVQKAVIVSLTVSGGITSIVRFTGLVIWPIVGYFLDTRNSGSTTPVTLSTVAVAG